MSPEPLARSDAIVNATDLRPLHPVDQLTTWELAAYRANLEAGLAGASVDGPTRTQLQTRLDAVLAEVEDRERIRRANGQAL